MQRLLKENKLDGYIITDSEDVWYFSNILYRPEQRTFFFQIESPFLLSLNWKNCM
ncbi:aminopeptidase P family N-terminal domain-containing protein [Tetragenococcus solitarius]|uniref:aminopeptidase P family N-terminal domain-containing protein n=1 Tax=Tetragenococcus solitarius TaxID=71453 RepID=UPI00147042A6